MLDLWQEHSLVTWTGLTSNLKVSLRYGLSRTIDAKLTTTKKSYRPRVCLYICFDFSMLRKEVSFRHEQTKIFFKWKE